MRVVYVVRREQVDVSRVTMRDERPIRTSGMGARRMGVNGGWGGVGLMLRGGVGTAGRGREADFRAGRVALSGGGTGHGRVGLDRVGLDASPLMGSSSPISERTGKLLEAYGTGGREGEDGDTGSSSS